MQVGQRERIAACACHTRCAALVEQFLVARRRRAMTFDAIGLSRKSCQRRQLPLVPVLRKPVQQFLACGRPRTPGSARCRRSREAVSKIAPSSWIGLHAIAVVAIAVGGLHQHEIGLRDRSGSRRIGVPSGRDRRKTRASCRRPTAPRSPSRGCAPHRGSRRRCRAGSSNACRTAAPAPAPSRLRHRRGCKAEGFPDRCRGDDGWRVRHRPRPATPRPAT